jgi:hypothetical protein
VLVPPRPQHQLATPTPRDVNSASHTVVAVHPVIALILAGWPS